MRWPWGGCCFDLLVKIAESGCLRAAVRAGRLSCFRLLRGGVDKGKLRSAPVSSASSLRLLLPLCLPFLFTVGVKEKASRWKSRSIIEAWKIPLGEHPWQLIFGCHSIWSNGGIQIFWTHHRPPPLQCPLFSRPPFSRPPFSLQLPPPLLDPELHLTPPTSIQISTTATSAHRRSPPPPQPPPPAPALLLHLTCQINHARISHSSHPVSHP